jgi:hypothetical protein
MKTISDNIKSILAIIIVSSVILYLFMITWLVADNTVRSQALIAMVSLITGVTGYYFGHSQGASKKDEAQAAQIANSQTTVVSPAPDK